VLYEILGGERAFKAGSAEELLRLKRGAQPPALSSGIDVDPRIKRAVMHCLEPDPRDRPASAAAVAAALFGGDALTATIAAGETPEPELVARAGATEGLPLRIAVTCLAGAIAALIAFALLAPRISILSRLSVESSDALDRVARDTLSRLGIHDRARHQVARFGYDIEALRQHFDAAALYFWYRASPYWMVPREPSGVITPEDPPGELPGMVTTRWDGTGRLLYLRAVPAGATTSTVTASELWTRLFAAAGLQPGQFKPAEPGWIEVPGYEARASWTGTYPDRNRTPVRVEAAAWHGQPIYFEVLPAWLKVGGVARATKIERVRSSQLAVYAFLFVASAVLAWRNVHLGRGDRRGALRIALFIFVGECAEWACRASHVPDLTEFTLLFAALLWAGFLAVYIWTIYIALEPYVRRRWPHAIISWTRILSGKLHDPVVGGHILIGTTFGAATVLLLAIGISLAGAYGFRLPSYWMLSGARGTFAYVLSNVMNAVIRGLLLLFLACFFKVVFQRAWLAAVAILPLALAFEVPASPLAPGAVSVLFIVITVASVYLLLRSGLLPLIVGIYTFLTLIALPLTTNLFFPATGASVFMLCSVAASALFGFRSTLAGRRLFKLDW